MNRRKLTAGLAALLGSIGFFALPEHLLAKSITTEKSLLDIEVRSLLDEIQKACVEAQKDCMFEFNDTTLRQDFTNWMNGELEIYKENQLIQDYKVVCDETNNTTEVIDSNSFVADIYIKPEPTKDYIQLTLTTVRTGVNFDECEV